MGLEFAGATVVMGALGWWIDTKIGSAPVGVITGGLMGFTGGMYLLIKEGMKANTDAAAAMKLSPKRPRKGARNGSPSNDTDRKPDA